MTEYTDMLDERAYLFLETCRETRAEQVREDRIWTPVIEVLRDEGSRAHIMCPGDKHAMLRAASIAVSGFGATRLLVCMDAFGSAIPWKQGDPMPELPAPGEYQRRWEAGDRADITEQLVVMVVNRDPYQFEEIIQQYVTDETNKTITWNPQPYAATVMEERHGFMPKAFREIMNQPPMMEMLEAKATEDGRLDEFRQHRDALAPAQAEYHAAIAVCKILTDAGYAVAMWATTEEANWADGRHDVIVGRPGEDLEKAVQRHQLRHHTEPFTVEDDDD